MGKVVERLNLTEPDGFHFKFLVQANEEILDRIHNSHIFDNLFEFLADLFENNSVN